MGEILKHFNSQGRRFDRKVNWKNVHDDRLINSRRCCVQKLFTELKSLIKNEKNKIKFRFIQLVDDKLSLAIRKNAIAYFEDCQLKL